MKFILFKKMKVISIKFFNLHIFIFLFLLTIGLYFSAIKIMGADFDQIPGDMADGRLNNYFLEHGHLFFTGKIDHYWNAPFMFPEKDVMTYSDNLLGTLPIYSTFRFLGANRESAYQGWIIVLFALNFIISAYALYKISGNLSIASIGAYIFSFSLPVIAQMNHAQVFPRFFIPLVFMWMIFFFHTQKIKYLIGIIIGIVLQFYAGIYLGFLLAFCVLVCMLVYLFNVKQIKEFAQGFGRGKIFQIVGWGILSLALLLPLLYPYYERSVGSGTRAYEEVVNSIPYIKSYFFAWQGSFSWSFLTKTAMDIPIWWDHFLFPGGLVILAFFLFPIIAYKQPKDKFRTAAITVYISTLLIIMFTLQINGVSLYKFIYHLPGFSSMRAIGRIIQVELFLFALIVVYSITWITKNLKHKNLLLVLLAGICVFDQFTTETMGTYSKEDSQNRVRTLENKLMEKDFNQYYAFAYIPDNKNESESYVQIDAMLASQKLNISTINGYTASCPGEFGPFWRNYDSLSLNNWLLSRNMDIAKNKILLIK